LLDAMHKADAKASVAPVPNVKVFTAGKKMPLAVEGRGEFSWLLTTEEGISTKATPPAAKLLTFRRSCRRAITPDAHPGRPAFSLPGDRRAKTLL
jgi:hypothetical protein